MRSIAICLLGGASVLAAMSFSDTHAHSADAKTEEPPKLFSRPDDPTRIQNMGGFSIWTLRRKNAAYYHIVVEVELPKGTTSYSTDDLFGSRLKGVDGYTQTLPGKKNQTIQVINQKAQVVFFIPASEGGKTPTTDELTLKSRLLNQTQVFSVTTPN